MHANMQKNLTRDFLRHQGGSGKHFEEPPNDFEAEIKDEKERKKMFSKFGREGMISSKSYNKWLGQDCNIFTDSMERSTERSVNEDEDIEDGLNEKIKLVRERSSGHNIFDAEKTVFTKCQDGTTKKSVIKETYAKVTIRKRHQGTLESTKEYEISGSGATKRAKAVDNILNHTSEHDKLAKAVMVAKIIDKEGSEFGEEILQKSKVMQETRSLNPEQTASMITGTRSADYVWRQARTAFKNTLGYSPLASQKKVESHREKVMVTKKEDWDFQKMKIYQNKMGKNKGLATETPVLQVNNLESYIVKHALNEASELDLSSKELPICIDADAGGGRFLAVFCFLNRFDKDVKLHPWLLFKGSDSRKNMEMTIGKSSEQIRNLEGKEVTINGEIVKIKMYALFDLCALNCLVGKQNHSSTFPCAWTSVSKDHLQNHSGNEHIPSKCQDIKFLSMEEYERNLTHHLVGEGGKSSAKAGKTSGSVTGTNLVPLENILRYLPPLMHLVMGLANDIIKELVKDVVKFDGAESGNQEVDEDKKQVQENLLEMYSEVEDLEAQLSNVSLAKMVIMNDLKRIPLLKNGLLKEADEVSRENYTRQNKQRKNKRQSCDAISCLLFTIDVENDWDQMFTCKNLCKIHLRCEGIALINEDEELPEGYECGQCEKKKPNHQWIKEALITKNEEFTQKQLSINLQITSVKAEIDHNEHIEETVSGPRQRKLKAAMKKLGDVARYHGGDLQGKQVQTLLDDARNETFEIIDCVKDQKVLHDKYSAALTCLANVSDALKTEGDDFDETDIEMVTEICQSWGKMWPIQFPEKNITPKGHILSFVLPKTVAEHKTFFRFYKVEEKGRCSKKISFLVV